MGLAVRKQKAKGQSGVMVCHMSDTSGKGNVLRVNTRKKHGGKRGYMGGTGKRKSGRVHRRPKQRGKWGVSERDQGLIPFKPVMEAPEGRS